MKKNIMLVDDDPSILRLLKSALEKNGYDTILCESGEDALENLRSLPVDAIILDILLPRMDGFEVLKKIRSHAQYCHMPVIMLTCKDSEVETVLGLEAGADDYLNKPVRYHELMARLKNIFRRTADRVQPQPRRVEIHGLEINLDNRTACMNKIPVLLTYKEFELFVLPAKNPGKVFTRDLLLERIWHEEQFLESRTVDVHIRRLRKKFEACGLDPNMIETVRSVGYRLAEA